MAHNIGKQMLALKLIHCFSSHPLAFWFWSSSPPDNVTLNPTNMKADQSLPHFKTCIDVAAHATLDTELFISHTRTAIVTKIASLQYSEAGLIPVSKVHQLLTKIHNILDSVVFNQFGDTAHISANLFNSAFRQCSEVWASHFPFFQNLPKDSVPPR